MVCLCFFTGSCKLNAIVEQLILCYGYTQIRSAFHSELSIEDKIGTSVGLKAASDHSPPIPSQVDGNLLITQ